MASQNPPTPAGRSHGMVMSFLLWYMLRKPGRIVRSYLAYARVVLEVFSMWFLLKTLLKPWKNIVEAYPKSFLDVERVMEAFFLNVTTRLVGALVRLVVIGLGLLTQLLLLAFFALYLGVWLTFPLIVLFLLVI